jgi:hypothetical protein
MQSIKWILLLIVTAGVIFGIYYAGELHVQTKFDAYKAEVKRLGEAQIKLNKEKSDEAAKVTKQVADDWAANLNAVRASYDKRMRQQSSSSGVSVFPVAPRTIDEIPSDGIPLAGICAETTLQLDSLQTWIREQKAIYK